jgi:hypothetical protein
MGDLRHHLPPTSATFSAPQKKVAGCAPPRQPPPPYRGKWLADGAPKDHRHQPPTRHGSVAALAAASTPPRAS